MRACSGTQLSLTLCNTMDCSLPDSSVHGIFQARIWKWVAISYSRDLSSRPRGQTDVSSINRQILYHWATWEASRRCSSTPNESKVIGCGIVFEVMSATIDLHSFPMTGVPSGAKLCTVRGWEQRSWFSVCWANTLCKRFCQFWKRKLGTGLGTQLSLLRFCAL